jgi:hypothetical protein
MNDLTYWTTKLQEAECELDTAKTRTALDTAAKKLMRAKEALKRLEFETATRPERSSRGSRSAAFP